MSKRKRIGTPQYLNKGFDEVASIAENYSTPFNDVVISLTNVELDPDNPRKLGITIDHIKAMNGDIRKIDKSKRVEYEKLIGLSESIKQQGLLSPIILYKGETKYRVVAGERRTLAALLAGLSQVDARVFHNRPTDLDLKLVQWAENMSREGLTLHERLYNIKQIDCAFQKKNNSARLAPSALRELTGISKSQASAYLTVINSYEDLLEAIKTQQINNLDKAAIIAKIENTEDRIKVIQHCNQGGTLKSLKDYVIKINEKPLLNNGSKGRPKTYINLGRTNLSPVIQTIVDSVIATEKFSTYRNEFNNVEWSDVNEANKVFKKFIKIMEKEVV